MKPQSTAVWITGAGGLIGSYLARNAPQQFKVIPLTRTDFDLTDFAAVDKKFASERPGIVIHCAAMSRVPDCQANPAHAKKINFEVTAHLAGLAADIPFFFFSSDMVFDGRKGNYVETDAPNPLNYYGETKLAAEKIVLQNRAHTVLRTSLNGGISPKGNHAFNEELANTWRAGKTAKLFVDEFRSPIPAAVTARAVWELAAQTTPGLYHLGGSERLSRPQIASLVAARHPELTPRTEETFLRDFKGPPRPADPSMICDKIQRVLSFPLPGFCQWLKENPTEPF